MQVEMNLLITVQQTVCTVRELHAASREDYECFCSTREILHYAGTSSAVRRFTLKVIVRFIWYLDQVVRQTSSETSTSLRGLFVMPSTVCVMIDVL